MDDLLIAGGLVAAAASSAGLFAYGGLSSQSQLFGPSLVAPPDPRQLALTFDDGPNPAATPGLLEVLARHRVLATFFLIGRYAVREPGLVREIAAAGHTIGNHTMDHRWLPRHSEAVIREEIRGCNGALEELLGVGVGLFRPPHGARRPAVFRAAREAGLQVCQWNLMVGTGSPARLPIFTGAWPAELLPTSARVAEPALFSTRGASTTLPRIVLRR